MTPSTEMFIGTWKQNVAKSHYWSGPPLNEPAIQTIAAVHNGLRFTLDTEASQKRVTEFTVKFEREDHLMGEPHDGNSAGGRMNSTMSAKLIDDRTIELNAKLPGKLLVISRIVISKDGALRTDTVNGSHFNGQPFNETIVYNKLQDHPQKY